MHICIGRKTCQIAFNACKDWNAALKVNVSYLSVPICFKCKTEYLEARVFALRPLYLPGWSASQCEYSSSESSVYQTHSPSTMSSVAPSQNDSLTGISVIPYVQYCMCEAQHLWKIIQGYRVQCEIERLAWNELTITHWHISTASGYNRCAMTEISLYLSIHLKELCHTIQA